MFYIVLCTFLVSSAFAEVGQVMRLIGKGAYVVRGAQKLPLTLEMKLNEKDIIRSEGSNVFIQIYPASRLLMSSGSIIKITKHAVHKEKDHQKINTEIELMSGPIRFLSNKGVKDQLNQKIELGDIAFSIQGTEFEISTHKTFVDLDVHQGEVEVTSPEVHTFLPEIVKTKEGFRFLRTKKAFSRRKFEPKLMNLKW